MVVVSCCGRHRPPELLVALAAFPSSNPIRKFSGPWDENDDRFAFVFKEKWWCWTFILLPSARSKAVDVWFVHRPAQVKVKLKPCDVATIAHDADFGLVLDGGTAATSLYICGPSLALRASDWQNYHAVRLDASNLVVNEVPVDPVLLEKFNTHPRSMWWRQCASLLALARLHAGRRLLLHMLLLLLLCR